MGENTKIEWAHHTFNPWIGCTKVSPGCKNCYAEDMMDKRYKRVSWGKGNPRQRTSPANWRKPLRWNRQAKREGVRYRVFCASLADVFDPEVPDEWRIDLMRLIEQTPHLDWLLLTKRPDKMFDFLFGWMSGESGAGLSFFGDRWSNVWLGVSVESQEQAAARIPTLLSIPARVRFLSCEPLLGPLDLSLFLDVRHEDEYDERGITIENQDQRTPIRQGLPFHDPWISPVDWIIVGGESGPNARPMHPAWVRSLRDQCVAAKVPLLFKQWGAWRPATQEDVLVGRGFREVAHIDYRGRDKEIHEAHVPESDCLLVRVGKKEAGSTLDGQTWDEVPS